MNNRIFAGIAAGLAGVAGVAIGALVRQPEINKLHALVWRLQQDLEKMEQVVRIQNQDIEHLHSEYQKLKFYQVNAKRALKDEIRDALLLQYATSDYIDLLYSYSENESNLSKDDITFCKTYSKAIEDGVIDDAETDSIRDFVMNRHKARIAKLQECDLEPLFSKIRSS